MFHIGHLNLLKNARAKCEYLIVGVNSDDLVRSYKSKTPIINESERAEIVRNIKGVDACVIVDTLDKMAAYDRFHFDVIFIGDDWKGNPRWKQTEVEMKEVGVDLVYLPHTAGVSSSALTTLVKNLDEEV